MIIVCFVMCHNYNDYNDYTDAKSCVTIAMIIMMQGFTLRLRWLVQQLSCKIVTVPFVIKAPYLIGEEVIQNVDIS